MITGLAEAIRDEFLIKQTHNPNYSLRAFARDLDVSPGYLSSIVNKKTEPKLSKSRELITKVFKDSEIRSEWIEQLDEIPQRYFYTGKIKKYNKIFRQTEMTWAHYATLEIFNLSSFQSDLNWMESRLGIGNERLLEILGDLESLGAISFENNEYTSHDLSFSNIADTSTSESRRQMQKDLLAQSIMAIDEVGIESRDHTSMTISMNKNQVNHVKKRIKEFRRELCCELSSENKTSKDEVYQFQFSVFPLVSARSSK